jgi:hypothetical protein
MPDPCGLDTLQRAVTLRTQRAAARLRTDATQRGDRHLDVRFRLANKLTFLHNRCMDKVVFEGVDPAELAAALKSGIDIGGNTIEPFVVNDDGWTMRCCLQDSRAGDEVAMVAWSPFIWTGPYRETGPGGAHHWLSRAVDAPRAAGPTPVAADDA